MHRRIVAVLLIVGCRPAPSEPPAAPPVDAVAPAPVAADPAPPAEAATDTDQDGVPDRDDRCPTQPQAMGPGCTRPTDGDGCPDACAAPRSF